eukprot:TRINITY_DN13433_c0_g1_i3.p1 TRINITY_DN13433_c0_g1~~TRINITY_DN13433_c0_g1_i3.p1  ORF type:complete len:298 (-),score=39.43 TRINITY_DN13433_c0_g1_i3:65-958(-)
MCIRDSGEIVPNKEFKRDAYFPATMTSELAVAMPFPSQTYYGRKKIVFPEVYVGVFLGIPFFRSVVPDHGSNNFMPETWYPFREVGLDGGLLLFNDRGQTSKSTHRFDQVTGTESWAEVKETIVGYFLGFFEDLTGKRAKLEPILKAEWEAKTLVDRWQLFPQETVTTMLSAGLGGDLWQTPLGRLITSSFSFCPPQGILPPAFYNTELLRHLSSPAIANNWIARHHATTLPEGNGCHLPQDADQAAGQASVPLTSIACAPKIHITRVARAPAKKTKTKAPKENTFKYQHFGDDGAY